MWFSERSFAGAVVAQKGVFTAPDLVVTANAGGFGCPANRLEKITGMPSCPAAR